MKILILAIFFFFAPGSLSAQDLQWSEVFRKLADQLESHKSPQKRVQLLEDWFKKDFVLLKPARLKPEEIILYYNLEAIIYELISEVRPNSLNCDSFLDRWTVLLHPQAEEVRPEELVWLTPVIKLFCLAR